MKTNKVFIINDEKGRGGIAQGAGLRAKGKKE